MDTFKEVLEKRLLAMATYAAGLVLLAVMGFMFETAGETEEIRLFMTGMNAGCLRL